MKKIILLFLLFAGFFASAQTVVDPHTFPQETNPNNSNFEFYSRALGSNKRATFNNVRKNMSPGIVAVGFTPSPSGNTTNFGDFVLDPSDALWYIAYSGDAVQLPYNTPFSAGAGISISGGNVITNTGDLSNTNELQTISIAGQNLTLSNGGGTVTIPAGAIYTAGTGITILSNVVTNTGDLSATNEGLLSVSPGTDTTAIINSNTSGSPSLTILVRGGLSIDETGNTIILEGGAGDGVSSVTGTDGNGFDITVVNPTTAPEISIATTVTGITYGSLGELDAVTVGYGLDFTAPTLRVDTSEVASPYDLSLIDRGFISTSDGTSHTVTLTPGGGSFKLVEGSNITLTTSGTADDGIITIASTGGGGSGTVEDFIFTDGNGFNGTVSTSTTTPTLELETTVTGLIYGGSGDLLPVTIGSGLSFSAPTLSAVDVSATNELQTLYTDDRTSSDWTFGVTPAGNTLTLDAFTSTLSGLTPGSGGGTTNFLRADGTWAAPPGSGGISEPAGQVVVGNGSGADSYPEMKYLTTPNDLQLLNTSGANNANLSVRTTDTTGTVTIGESSENSTKYRIYAEGNGPGIMKIEKDDRNTTTSSITDFYMGRSFFPLISSGGDNQVFAFGFNLGPQGRVNRYQNAIGYGLEQNFVNGALPGITGHGIYEPHLCQLIYSDTVQDDSGVKYATGVPNNTDRRPLSGAFSNEKPSKGGFWTFNSDKIDFNDFKTATQRATINVDYNPAIPKGLIGWDTLGYYQKKNNAGGIWQRNAANSSDLGLILLDNQDRLALGFNSVNKLYTTAQSWELLAGMHFKTSSAGIIEFGAAGNEAGQMIVNTQTFKLRNSTVSAGFDHVASTSYEIRESATGRVLFGANPGLANDGIRFRNQGQGRCAVLGGFPDFDKVFTIGSSAFSAADKMFNLKNTTGTFTMYRYSGNPETLLNGEPGDIAVTPGETYIKESGTSSTGWAKVATESGARVFKMTRALPAVGNTINIGTFTASASAGAMLTLRVSLDVSGNAAGRIYNIPTRYNATGGTWEVLLPASSSGPYAGPEDFQVEINGTTSSCALRVRTMSGSFLGTLYLTLAADPWIASSHSFTESSTVTTAPTAVTTTYRHHAISQVQNKVGVNTLVPTEALHVTGNARISGAFMPNNAAGTSGQILQSAGAGSPPTWVNQSTITGVNIYNTDGSLTGNRTVTLGSNSIKFLTSNSLGTYPGLISQTYNDGTDNNPYFTGKDHLSTDRFYITGEGTDVRIRSINGGLRMAANSSVYLTAGSPSKTLEWKDTGVAVFPSSSPSSPAGGSVWYSSAQKLSYRESSSTRTVASIEGDITGSALQLVTSNNTPGGSDNLTYRFDANAGSFTVTLDNTLVEGRWYTMRCTRNGTNTITFNAGSGYSLAIDGSSTLTPLSFVAGASGTGIEAPYRIYTVRRMDTVIYIK